MSHKQSEWNASQWLSQQEGKLSVDVIETDKEVIVRSAIAGIVAADLDITLTDDTLTIRGERHYGNAYEQIGYTHVQECHWGAFSRTIILPCHVDPDQVDATIKRGILTITMKKIEMEKTIRVLEVDDL
jgi:HSP20 family protein